MDSQANPWRDIRELQDSYVLESDRDLIKTTGPWQNKSRKVIEQSIPEPFIGNPRTATVVLLGLNPGHSDEDQKYYRENEPFRNAIFTNLRHGPQEYPFYPLNPLFRNTPVGKWWLKRTRDLREQLRMDEKTIAERLMVIEWFPYHSANFDETKHRCKSQKYSFDLAKEMLEGNRVIVGMRSKRLWTRVDPRFEDVDYLTNPQCSYFSRGNMDGNFFKRVSDALRDDRRISNFH